MFSEFTPNVTRAACILTTATGALLYKRLPTSKASKAYALGFLTMCAIISTLFFFRFGEIHQYGNKHRLYHYHDFFHYFIGAKYYEEISNIHLYDCTAVALDELKNSGIRVPAVESVRSLKDAMASTSLAATVQSSTGECHSLFSPGRWESFKNDLQFFLSLPWDESWWKVILFDLGNNSPPAWNLIAGAIANIVPLNNYTINLLTLIDSISVIILVPIVIFMTFGLPSALAYLGIYGGNWLAGFEWVGGSFFRQDWLVFLALSICALKSRRFTTSGILMGLATATRVFPLFFAVGVVISLSKNALHKKAFRSSLVSYLKGIAISIFILSFLSLIIFPKQNWDDFFSRIFLHSKTLFVMHIGYLKYAVYNSRIGNQDFWFGPGLDRFNSWQQGLLNYYATHHLFFDSIKFLAIGTSLILCYFLPAISAGFLCLLTLLFFSNIPANYYYAWLALLPIGFFNERFSYASAERLIALGMTLAFIPLAAISYPDAILLNGKINTALFVFCIFTILTYSYQIGFPAIGLSNTDRKATILQKGLFVVNFLLVCLAITSLT